MVPDSTIHHMMREHALICCVTLNAFPGIVCKVMPSNKVTAVRGMWPYCCIYQHLATVYIYNTVFR